MGSRYASLNAAEAAALIPRGAELGLSGFTATGTPKAIPRALLARARAMQAAGTPLALQLLTGASTGPDVDDALADADAIAWRAPYQSSRALRTRINDGRTAFVDMHLSHLPQMIEFGFFGAIDWAIVEAHEVTEDGRVYLTTGIGIAPSLLRHAERILIERNRRPSPRLAEMHDIALLPPPPRRSPIPIHEPLDRIGTPYASVDPRRIVGIVETDEPDRLHAFGAPDETSRRIARHVAQFLGDELRLGRMPREFLPVQAGVGNLSNAVMAALGADPQIPPFTMFTEVLQDSIVPLLEQQKVLGASTASLSFTEPVMQHVFDAMDFFSPRIVLRPQEISNQPAVIRQLGVVTINTVLELDLNGCANSTHVCGTQMMNGIGGSGDFVRNGALSILMAPSTAKEGDVSTVVPLCSHVDHTEHSVQVLVTEQGLADLRGLGPRERARRIIEQCAHPEYRDYLLRYLESAPPGHLRQDLRHCFDLHRALLEHGTMRAAL